MFFESPPSHRFFFHNPDDSKSLYIWWKKYIFWVLQKYFKEYPILICGNPTKMTERYSCFYFVSLEGYLAKKMRWLITNMKMQKLRKKACHFPSCWKWYWFRTKLLNNTQLQLLAYLKIVWISKLHIKFQITNYIFNILCKYNIKIQHVKDIFAQLKYSNWIIIWTL